MQEEAVCESALFEKKEPLINILNHCLWKDSNPPLSMYTCEAAEDKHIEFYTSHILDVKYEPANIHDVAFGQQHLSLDQ